MIEEEELGSESAEVDACETDTWTETLSTPLAHTTDQQRLLVHHMPPTEQKRRDRRLFAHPFLRRHITTSLSLNRNWRFTVPTIGSSYESAGRDQQSRFCSSAGHNLEAFVFRVRSRLDPPCFYSSGGPARHAQHGRHPHRSHVPSGRASLPLRAPPPSPRPLRGQVPGPQAPELR